MNSYTSAKHLLEGFAQAVQNFSERAALHVQHQNYTYAELDSWSQTVATAVRAHTSADSQFIGILSQRSLAAYASILGTLRAGKCYVPLNPRFPPDRSVKSILAARLSTLIAGADAEGPLAAILRSMTQPLTLICETQGMVDRLRPQFPQLEFVCLESFQGANVPAIPVSTNENDPAYLLFTSGSTGVPKGVPVSHRNAIHYLQYTTDRYDVTCEDRFSQTFDLTFDLSVHDMFVCWGSGACLFILPEKSSMAPAKFIVENRLTMWFSVPSVVAFMQRMHLLRPASLPTIRYSLFCGEPLLASSAIAWQQAACNSVIENLYGPTEATIATTQYRWNKERDELQEFPNGVVPIGKPFSGQFCTVVDASQRPVAQGELGELCLAGPQVTAGYLYNEEKTRQQFVKLDHGDTQTWYRTGDLVTEDDSGCIYYRGRIDDQLQVRGHRVELQEIEHVLRGAGGESAVALGWPLNAANTETIYCVFCESERQEIDQLSEYCRNKLPEYMIPSRIFFVPHIPLNANGKTDRRAIGEMVKEIVNAE